MKKRERENFITIFGLLFLIFGLLFTINFYLNSNIYGMFGSLISIIVGLVLLVKVFS